MRERSDEAIRATAVRDDLLAVGQDPPEATPLLQRQSSLNQFIDRCRLALDANASKVFHGAATVAVPWRERSTPLVAELPAKAKRMAEQKLADNTLGLTSERRSQLKATVANADAEIKRLRAQLADAEAERDQHLGRARPTERSPPPPRQLPDHPQQTEPRPANETVRPRNRAPQLSPHLSPAPRS